MAQTNAKPELTLEITALSYGPYGIGRTDGKAVMVRDTAPGDQIVAQLVESKERYAIGEALRVITPSPLRQTPPCPYVGRCGGCSWQHLRYESQLQAKQQSVKTRSAASASLTISHCGRSFPRRINIIIADAFASKPTARSVWAS